MASRGDDWAVDKLMSRPVLSEEAEPFFAAWFYLRRDRPFLSHGAGMAGGLLLQQKSTREAIKAEGHRTGHRGDDLEDFVEIVAGLEDIDFDVTLREQAKQMAAAAKKKTPK